jgi:hypothetical protein
MKGKAQIHKLLIMLVALAVLVMQRAPLTRYLKMERM